MKKIRDKMYLRLQITQNSHQIIRVDNIKEFAEIINSGEFAEFVQALSARAKLHVLSQSKEKFKAEPYKISVSEETFSAMSKEINRKIGNWKKYTYDVFSLVLNSHTMPIIQIFKTNE